MQTGFARMMNYPSLAFLLALPLTLTGCGGPSGPIDGGAAMAHVDALLAIGPRPFGSDNLGKAADYICDEIKKIGLEPKRHELIHPKEKKTIRNLYCQIDGADPVNGPILMIGAHYDTKLAAGHADASCNFPFAGAIDGTGGPAVLIELARTIHNLKEKPTCNVWLYWIDAEESIDWTWNDDRAMLGSAEFYKWMIKTGTKKRLKAFVLLDLIGSKDMKFDRDGNSSKKLLDLFEAAAKEMGAADRLYEFPTRAELDDARRKGYNWGTKDDHMNFRGVPCVLLIDFARRIPAHLQNLEPGQPAQIDPRYETWWHTQDDNRDAMDSDSLAFAGNLVMQAMPALEDFINKKKRK
jgi:glutaminyl-peptide cyclotransferase